MKTKGTTLSNAQLTAMAAGWLTIGMVVLLLLQGVCGAISRRYDHWRERLIVEAVERAVKRVEPVNYAPTQQMEHYNREATGRFCLEPPNEWFWYCAEWFKKAAQEK